MHETNQQVSAASHGIPSHDVHGTGHCCLNVLYVLQRAMGEFGAVSVISGNIIGKTQTLTLYVESAYKEYNTEAAFSAAVLLSFLALITLVIKEVLIRASNEDEA